MDILSQRSIGLFVSVLLVGMLLTACGGGGGGGGGSETTQTSAPGFTPAEGTLLVGDPNRKAVESLSEAIENPVSEADVIDGLLSTRLEAVINPDATVAEVNAALESISAGIVTMDDGSLLVALSIPPVKSLDDAKELAAQLERTGAFLSAFPSYAPAIDVIPTFVDLDAREGEDVRLHHLKSARALAAWNVKDLVNSEPAHRLPVLVPDIYYRRFAHPDISAQRFVDGSFESDKIKDNCPKPSCQRWYEGNHGFHVSGIIGANLDGVGATGIHPLAGSVLDIDSFGIGNKSFRAILSDMGVVIERTAQGLPSGMKFVLNTSLSFQLDDNGAFVNTEYKRALYALQWRKTIYPYVERFFHAAAAGNNGKHYAQDMAPWNISAKFPDLRDYVKSEPAITRAFFDTHINWATRFHQVINRITDNVLIVGSSRGYKNESKFSSKLPDVRMIGEGIYGPCAAGDPSNRPQDWPSNQLCNGKAEIVSGTSQAAPQVAGLAAYLWGLDPTLEVQDIIRILKDSFDEDRGVVDAYDSVLALDSAVSPADARIRHALLDVTDDSMNQTADNAWVFNHNSGDGRFDSNDVAVILSNLNKARAKPDYSRYDLNGDGNTDSSSRYRFDLNIAGPQKYEFPVPGQRDIGGSPRVFDENEVSDLDILCYYAYSDLYQGETAPLDELFRDEIDNCGYLGFDFALGHLSVDGNISQSGPPDGALDFVDEFDDSSLISKPTSLFSFTDQTKEQTAESGGFLHLTSADGAFARGSDGGNFVLDSVLLSGAVIGEVGEKYIIDGNGDSFITAAFRQDRPRVGQFYCLGLGRRDANSIEQDYVEACVTSRDGNSVVLVVADENGVIEEYPIDGDFEKVVRPDNVQNVEHLRLWFHDNDNTVEVMHAASELTPFQSVEKIKTKLSSFSSYYVYVIGASHIDNPKAAEATGAQGGTVVRPSANFARRGRASMVPPPPLPGN